jgi:hypothetical protein
LASRATSAPFAASRRASYLERSRLREASDQETTRKTPALFFCASRELQAPLLHNLSTESVDIFARADARVAVAARERSLRFRVT